MTGRQRRLGSMCCRVARGNQAKISRAAAAPGKGLGALGWECLTHSLWGTQGQGLLSCGQCKEENVLQNGRDHFVIYLFCNLIAQLSSVNPEDDDLMQQCQKAESTNTGPPWVGKSLTSSRYAWLEFHKNWSRAD